MFENVGIIIAGAGIMLVVFAVAVDMILDAVTGFYLRWFVLATLQVGLLIAFAGLLGQLIMNLYG